jgi:hypothetical protein
MRELLKPELEDQAEWRRHKAVEYLADHRNLDAAEENERLAKTVQDIPDHLLVAYSEAFENLPDSEHWQEMLKDIFRGFFDPADATELVESFLARKRYSESFVDALRLLAELDRLGLEGHRSRSAAMRQIAPASNSQLCSRPRNGSWAARLFGCAIPRSRPVSAQFKSNPVSIMRNQESFWED